MLIWVYRGPRAGEFMDIEESSARQAIEDGWAKEPGLDGTKMPTPSIDDYEPAVRYLSNPGAYTTRELRASPPGKAVPPKEKPKKD